MSKKITGAKASRTFLALTIVLFLLAGSSSAQTKAPQPLDRDVFTNLYFTAVNGAKWPIYLTPTGDRYAVRYSKFTKKQYRYYLPKSYNL